MSTSNQDIGKNNPPSPINTPSTSPSANMFNNRSPGTTDNIGSAENNSPKYDSVIPNRMFVGGIAPNITEQELMDVFSTYGIVKSANIIKDRLGVSKGYGFVTFETEDDAKRPFLDSESIVLYERVLNIEPAIKKRLSNSVSNAHSLPSPAGNPFQIFVQSGSNMPYFQQVPVVPGEPHAHQNILHSPSPMCPVTHAMYMSQLNQVPITYEHHFYQNHGGMPNCMSPPGFSHHIPPCYGQPMPGSSYGQQMLPPCVGHHMHPPCFNHQMPGMPGPCLNQQMSASSFNQQMPAPSHNQQVPGHSFSHQVMVPGYGQPMPTIHCGEPMFCNFAPYPPFVIGPPMYAEACDLDAPGSYRDAHQTAPTSQGFLLQPLRNNKRSSRPAGGLGRPEMGHADPLLKEEIEEACKQFESRNT